MAVAPRPSELAAGAIGGLVCGALATVYAVSNAALVFSGELAGAFSTGAGLALFGSCVIGLVVALGASFRNAVTASATGPASILALVAAAIATRLHDSAPEAILPTVIVVVALTSLLTGAFLYALGFFRLGAMPRYIPFPVVGGFLAGVGWLLLLGSIRIVTGQAVTLSGLPDLFTFENGQHLVPMLLLVGVLQWSQRRFRHFLALPTILVLAIAAFYAVAGLTGTGIEDLRAARWLTSPFPEGALWPPQALSTLGTADLGAVLAEAPRIGTIMVISVLTLLLGTTSMELAAGTEIDADRELRANGLANIAAGLGGGLLGYTGMSLSMLGRNACRDSRIPGIVAGLLCGAAALGAASWIDRLPVFVVAALLFSNGIGQLVEWIWRGRSKLPAADYLIVVLIVVVVGIAGFLQGVAIGILAGVILFVVNYSRLNVVKHVLSGATYHSNVERPAHLMRRLSELGDQIHVLTLHGYLFFGTANRLVEQLRERMNDASRQRLRYVLLDFRQVHGLDSSAAASFMKLRRDAVDRDLRIVVTSVHADVSRQLARGGFLLPNDGRVIEFAEQDLGLEWCEDRILGADDPGLDTGVQPHGWQGPAFSDPSMGAALRRYLEPVKAAEGDVLMRQGEHSSDLMFIDSGRVSVQLEMADGRSVRVRVFGPGTVVGEIALYLGVPRSASVIADRPTVAYRLTDEALKRMRTEEPALVAEFHQYIARLLAERLSEANKLLRSVLH